MVLSKHISYGEPIKNWTILRCVETDGCLRPGQWTMVYTRFIKENRKYIQPSFVFDNLLETVYDDADFQLYMNRVDQFEESLHCDPQTGYGFYSYCLQDGFDPFIDDFYIWVAEKITEHVIQKQKQLSSDELKRIMDMLVVMEEYEKAAVLRDLLNFKTPGRYPPLEKIF